MRISKQTIAPAIAAAAAPRKPSTGTAGAYVDSSATSCGFCCYCIRFSTGFKEDASEAYLVPSSALSRLPSAVTMTLSAS